MQYAHSLMPLYFLYPVYYAMFAKKRNNHNS